MKSTSIVTCLVALFATFFSTIPAKACYPVALDDSELVSLVQNTATSPYAVNSVRAILRAADPDKERANMYGLPREVPSVCKDKKVVVFNALVIEGHARPEIRELVLGRPLELLDDGITDARLKKILSHAQAEWKKETYNDCPVTLDDLKCDNQEAAALACCSAHFPMPWKHVEASFKGDTVDGFQLNGKVTEDVNGKAAFEVELTNETKLVVIENPYATVEDALKAVSDGSERKVVVPSISIDAENDYVENYPDYAGYVLKFANDAAEARLDSFKENVNFSMNEQGVFGISIVTMTAGSKGIWGSDEPEEEDVIYIDEPFRAFVTSTLNDGAEEIIFDVTVNTLK